MLSRVFSIPGKGRRQIAFTFSEIQQRRMQPGQINCRQDVILLQTYLKSSATLRRWLIKLIAWVTPVCAAFIRGAHTVSPPAPGCELRYYEGIGGAKGNKQHPL